MKRRMGLQLLALMGALILPAYAGTSRVEVRWAELSPLILGHTVTMVLPGAITVSGDAVAVREDSLLLDIRKTSDSKAWPKGSTSIPRASVNTIQLTETNRVGGRVLGVVVGALGGMVAGGEIVAHGNQGEGAAVSTFLAVSVAGSVGGYFTGKSVDRHTTLIRVAP